MNKEYIDKTDYLLDLIDIRNKLNKEITKTRNRLREIKKERKEKKI